MIRKTVNNNLESKPQVIRKTVENDLESKPQDRLEIEKHLSYGSKNRNDGSKNRNGSAASSLLAAIGQIMSDKKNNGRR